MFQNLSLNQNKIYTMGSRSVVGIANVMLLICGDATACLHISSRNKSSSQWTRVSISCAQQDHFFRQQQNYGQSNIVPLRYWHLFVQQNAPMNRAKQQIRRRKSTRRPVSRSRATRLTWPSKTVSKKQCVSSLR